METRVDVLVVGAGPAGSAAACTAARRGLDVLVVDKATFPRDKTCGDGLTTGALRILETLGFALDALPSYTSVRETVIVSPSGRQVHLTFPGQGEFAGVVPRAELDAALAALAAGAGATVQDGNGIVGLEQHDDGVAAEMADGAVVRARWMIAADGHYSAVRHLLEPDRAPRLGDWSTFRQYFRGVDDRRLWVLFEPDLLPGYAWVFPLPGGRANVGFAMRRPDEHGGRIVKERWLDLLARPSIRAAIGDHAAPEGPHRAWPVPTHYRPDALTSGRVLFVGDAAEVVDPMTGEGIGQALATGILAADAITPGGPPEQVARRYRTHVGSSLGRDLRFAQVVQHVLDHPLTTRAAMRAVDWNDWTRRNFARWMFEDYPRATLVTPDRWRRGLLTTKGAYRH